MSKIYLNSGKVLLRNGTLMFEENTGGGSIYYDNFDSYTGGNYLVGLGSWVSGMGNMVCWNISAGQNQVGPYSSTAYSAAIYNQVLSNDQYAQIKRTKVTADGYLGIGVRLSGSSTTFCGYVFLLKDSATGNTRLLKFTNGVAAQLGSAGTTPPSLNDIYKLTIVGNVLTCYKNGSIFTEVATSGQYTDSTYSSGKAGIAGYGSYNDTLCDEFECGEL